jgi:hypothetical protein
MDIKTGLKMKAKIGIICLTTRRTSLMNTHAKQLAKCKYTNFHIYVLGDNLNQEVKDLFAKELPNNSTVVDGFTPGDDNYIRKIFYGIDQNHEFSIKMDEDCILLADGWDKFFKLIESMTDEDLFCTGSISNGVPTCDFFVNNFLPESKQIIDNIFAMTKYGNGGGVDYSLLNNWNDGMIDNWSPAKFYQAVNNFQHFYKGIHPVRINFFAAKFINDMIFSRFPKTMQVVDGEIIRNKDYPYFCNSFFGIRTRDWKTIVSRQDLFVDPYEEVPLNRYWKETKKNMLVDTGIPILHTMYNWSRNWDYENNLVEKINKIFSDA